MFFTFDYWILGLPSINHSKSNHGLRVTAAATLLFFLLTSTPHAAAQPQSPTDDNYYNPRFNPSMGVVIIILISALFLMGFFSMYIRSCSEDTSSASANDGRAVTGRSRRGPRGLEPTIIESFPTFEYAAVKSLHLGKDALECAICLNEFEDDETLRLIPICDHVFHPECIGEWLSAHTTCPVCRTDLTPVPGESILTVPNLPSELAQICELGHSHSDDNVSGIASQQNGAEVIIQVVDQPVLPPPPLLASSTTDVVREKRDQQGVNYSYPVPSERNVADFSSKRLNRNRTRKWLGAMFSRSNSTGHVAVKQWENMDRFTLRIPDDLRKQIISGKLNRTTSCLALPAGEGSSRRGYRYGDGSSSRTGRRYYGDRGAAATKSDRWVFSLTPPFLSRASSIRSRRAGSRSVSRRSGGGSVRSNRDDGSVKGDSVRGGSVWSNRDDDSVKGDSLHGSIRSNRGDEPGLPPV